MSAHHAVFQSISSCVYPSLSFHLSGSIQISPLLSSSFFSACYFLPLPLSLPPYVSVFPLAVNTPLLCFYSCSLCNLTNFENLVFFFTLTN